jgi:hypothetical protein
MNTTPDEVLLALWLDDELEGEELAKVESWALTQPDQLAAREEVRAWRKVISAELPAEVEPPFPDFFNSRIEKSIRDLPAKEVQPAAPVRESGSFWRWLFPATAFAGMALAFWGGTKATEPSGAATVAGIDQKSVTPAWYSPEQGVNAEWVNGKGASGSVIVLQGVSAIPDSMDFSETVSFQKQSDSSSTAGATEVKPAR